MTKWQIKKRKDVFLMKNKTKSVYQRLMEELDKISASIEEIKKIFNKWSEERMGLNYENYDR